MQVPLGSFPRIPPQINLSPFRLPLRLLQVLDRGLPCSLNLSENEEP